MGNRHDQLTVGFCSGFLNERQFDFRGKLFFILDLLWLFFFLSLHKPILAFTHLLSPCHSDAYGCFISITGLLLSFQHFHFQAESSRVIKRFIECRECVCVCELEHLRTSSYLLDKLCSNTRNIALPQRCFTTWITPSVLGCMAIFNFQLRIFVSQMFPQILLRISKKKEAKEYLPCQVLKAVASFSRLIAVYLNIVCLNRF